jgi:hypothetical protein
VIEVVIEIVETKVDGLSSRPSQILDVARQIVFVTNRHKKKQHKHRHNNKKKAGQASVANFLIHVSGRGSGCDADVALSGKRPTQKVLQNIETRK